ncbi:hypothetical protein LCGC14_2564330, partial [marine sediment metagenome]
FWLTNEDDKVIEFNPVSAWTVPPGDRPTWPDGFYNGILKDVNALSGGLITDLNDIFIHPDGSKLYTIDQSTGTNLHQFSFLTAFDLSTLLYDNISVVLTTTGQEGVFFSGDGSDNGGFIYSSDTSNFRLDQFVFTVTDVVTVVGEDSWITPNCVPDATSFFSCVSSVDGLDHLEGEVIKLLVDGNVETSTVINGSASLDSVCAGRIHAGIGFCSTIETLDIEAPRGTIQGKNVKIPAVVTRFYKSDMPQVGPTIDNLTQIKLREGEAYGQPTQLFTGDKKQVLHPAWKSNGRLVYQHCLPTPLTILGIIPDIVLGDDDLD